MCGLLYSTLPRRARRNFTFPDQLGQRPQCFRSIDDNLQKIDVLITSMPANETSLSNICLMQRIWVNSTSVVLLLVCWPLHSSRGGTHSSRTRSKNRSSTCLNRLLMGSSATITCLDVIDMRLRSRNTGDAVTPMSTIRRVYARIHVNNEALWVRERLQIEFLCDSNCEPSASRGSVIDKKNNHIPRHAIPHVWHTFESIIAPKNTGLGSRV